MCHAQVDLRRRGGCARAFLERRKRQRTWPQGQRINGDGEEQEVIKDCLMKMLEEKEEYMKMLHSLEAYQEVCCMLVMMVMMKMTRSAGIRSCGR